MDSSSQRRRAAPVYLTDGERDCLDRAAAAQDTSRGAFMRRCSLYRAGWSGYSGPLFDLGAADVSELQRHQAADVLHETLRTLRELATSCSYLYNLQRRAPEPYLLRMIVKYCGIVEAFPEQLEELRRFDDSLQISFDLETIGRRLEAHNPITAHQVQNIAAILMDALTGREATNGTAKQG